LNSVEKDDKGNYLISSRYLCALFYINGIGGSVIWQMNGQMDEYKFQGYRNNTFSFAFQHHSRFHSRNDSTAIISIFDNGSDGQLNFQNSSAGMMMVVNFNTMICTLLQQHQISNDTGSLVLTTSEGRMQVLNNSSLFLGWGKSPYISEHKSDGTLIMQGQFGAENAAANYRAFKADWIGIPIRPQPYGLTPIKVHLL
jgi:hypothetical protein